MHVAGGVKVVVSGPSDILGVVMVCDTGDRGFGRAKEDGGGLKGLPLSSSRSDATEPQTRHQAPRLVVMHPWVWR